VKNRMVKGEDLQNRQAGKADPEPIKSPANGQHLGLAERIARARALRPPATRAACQDCWRLGRDQTIAAIEGPG